jgi:undecaprenyl pyrophosphate phosphatase UppP
MNNSKTLWVVAIIVAASTLMMPYQMHTNADCASEIIACIVGMISGLFVIGMIMNHIESQNNKS